MNQESAPKKSSFWSAWNSLNRMQHFNEVLSPASWLIFYFAFTLTAIAIFRPGLKLFLIAFIIDFLTYFIIITFDAKFYLRYQPGARLFFPDVKADEIALLSTGEKRNLYYEFASFPFKRTTWVLLTSAPKDVLPIWFMATYWKGSLSLTQSLTLVIALHLLAYTYFFGACVLENHRLVATHLGFLHRDQDWYEVYQDLDEDRFDKRFNLNYTISLLSLGILMPLTLATAVQIYWSESSLPQMLVAVISLSIFAFILAVRLWWLSFGYILSGMMRLFSVFEGIERGHESEQAFPTTVALSPVPLLAKFERIYNQMNSRLRKKEEEVSHWAILQSEESRLRSLGEVAALVLHDMATPLHVISYCNDRLRANPALASNPQFLERINNGIKRCDDLQNALRTYLRPTGEQEKSATLMSVLPKVQRLLDVRFMTQGQAEIEWMIDPRLEQVRFPISEQDFMHILMNLLSNSVHNLTDSEKTPKIIELRLYEDKSQLSLLVADNGTGLSQETFEHLTTHQINHMKGTARKGLGLRLVRNLIERSSGTLSVVSPGVFTPGTTFKIKFPHQGQL